MYVAIAYLDSHIKSEVGARLLNCMDFSVIDSRGDGLLSLMRNNYIINLKIEDSEIKWYGGKDRYPYIGLDGIQRKDVLTVVGYSVYNNKLIYIVSNYKGDIQILNKEQFKILSNYDYKLSNYSKKLGLRYIKRVSYSSRCELFEDCLLVFLPLTIKDKLTIEVKETNGINNVHNIVVLPKNLVDRVTEIDFNIDLKELNLSGFSVFRNLRKLNILSSVKNVFSAKESLKNLEYVYIKRTENLNRAFKDCKNLKKVEFGDIPKNIVNETFNGCSELNVDNIIKEGLISIGHLAFRKCDKITKVNLPKTLVSIFPDSFDECTNIKEFNINSLVLIDRGYKREKAYGRLLKGTKDAVINCNVDYPKTYLKKCVADNVRINFNYTRDNNIESKVLKAKLLGLPILYDDVPYIKENIQANLKLMRNEDWIESLNKLILNALRYRQSIILVGGNGFFVKLNLTGIDYDNYYINSFKLIDNVIIKYNDYNVYVSDISVKSNNVTENYVYLDIKEIECSGNVVDVDKRGNRLYIKYKDGSHDKISLDNI